MARIRGDAAEAAVLDRARRLTSAHGIASDADLGPLFETAGGGAEADDPALVRLRQMYETGGWILLESAIADIPTDLRWLFSSFVADVLLRMRRHPEIDPTAIVRTCLQAWRALFAGGGRRLRVPLHRGGDAADIRR